MPCHWIRYFQGLPGRMPSFTQEKPTVGLVGSFLSPLVADIFSIFHAGQVISRHFLLPGTV